MILGCGGGKFSDVMVECSHSRAGKAANTNGGNNMEKKTIGKFIAVLRKANGMTQKELGDRLFVSDKTVSRWERDECAPELSLIPAIAEIFGITTDELLRGERNSPEATVTDEIKPSIKSEKQFKTMLRARIRKYKNLSLISLGLIFAGLITAVICNNVFHEAILGICLTTLFILSSAISQYIFGANAFIPKDEDDDAYEQQINQANTTITKIATAIYFCAITILAFCIPLAFATKRTSVDINGNYVHHYYHNGDNWLNWGLFCVIVGLTVCGLTYLLFIKPRLINKSMITVPQNKEQLVKYRRKLLGKITAISGGILVILFASGFILSQIGPMPFVRKETYESLDEFKSAMIEDQKEFLETYRSLYYIDKDGNEVYLHSDIPDDFMLTQETVTDFAGNTILEYSYNSTLYKDISFSNKDSRTPVTVIKSDEYHNVRSNLDYVLQAIVILIFLDIGISIMIFSTKAYGKKSKKI